MASSRRVYVAVWGVYSQQGVGGVYDTPERAIAASHRQGFKWTRETSVDRAGRRFTVWYNDQDMDEAIRIEPFYLVTEGPEQPPDEAIVYTDSDDGNRILAVSEPATRRVGREVRHPAANRESGPSPQTFDPSTLRHSDSEFAWGFAFGFAVATLVAMFLSIVWVSL